MLQIKCSRHMAYMTVRLVAVLMRSGDRSLWFESFLLNINE